MTHLSYTVAGTGLPVLALHGLGGDHRQAIGLVPDGWRAIAPDMPGHGDTDLTPADEVSFDAFAGHAAQVLDSFRAQGTVTGPLPVVGVSMGAGIALRLARNRPDVVERLVLVRPSNLLDAPAANMRIFQTVGRLLVDLGPDAGAAAFREAEEYRTIRSLAPAMAESLLGQFTRPNARERARVLLDMPTSRPLDTGADYAAIDAPTTVVGAPQDPVHAEAVARSLADWIPCTRLVMVPRKQLEPGAHEEALSQAVAIALGATDHGIGIPRFATS